MKKKIALIDKICEEHPVYGCEKGWSWYHGGMEDTGGWYFRKMLDVPIKELQAFYDVIIERKNTPTTLKPLTEEEIRDSKILIKSGNAVLTLYEQKQLIKFAKEMDYKLLFGK